MWLTIREINVVFEPVILVMFPVCHFDKFCNFSGLVIAIEKVLLVVK